MQWQTSRFLIDLARPCVMGIVNVTPDSFFDGGDGVDAKSACARCERLVAEGADILDIGGESTRPGAFGPGLAEELRRVLPVLRHAVTLGVPVSVDTSAPEVMRAALDIGVDIVNDVRALRATGAERVVASHGALGVCLMHMRGEPPRMQAQPHLGDVVADVRAFLTLRRDALLARGVKAERIVLDPGIGFGKSPAQNLEIARNQRSLLELGQPVLVGWSRKSTLGVLTGRPVEERLPASLAAAIAAVEHGASIVRVHDVAATVDALAVWAAMNSLPPAEHPTCP
jgi:dihydropteroate synthase